MSPRMGVKEQVERKRERKREREREREREAERETNLHSTTTSMSHIALFSAASVAV